jgi:hypothetical protein
VVITNAHHATLNTDLISHLVQLSTTDYIGSEARDIVDVTKSMMFSILAGEEYNSTAINLNVGTIAEPDSADHASIKIAECISCTCHMV